MPKAFTNPHIATIQRNALKSWLALGREVQVLMIGNETGMAEAAAELGVQHLSNVEVNASGTPLISSALELMRQTTTSPLMVIANADIIFMPDFVEAARRLLELQQGRPFMALGQRWDLEVTERLDFSAGWDARLRANVQANGQLHEPVGSDYFLFPRELYHDLPKFAIGRSGWDNWMIYHARRQGWTVVELVHSVMLIHQNHDYSHLPGGKPPYRLPETMENIRLAGGKRAILYLIDVTHYLKDGKLYPQRGWRKFWREVETFPMVRLPKGPLASALAELSYACFHPVKAYKEWRGRIMYKLFKKA
jgi:hypothetical protein